jgi:hypothetical protein
MSSERLIKRDAIHAMFTKAYNNIFRAYDAASEDEELALAMCIAQARAPLEQPGIPRYHTIKTHLL